MQQLVQDLRTGRVEVVVLPDPAPRRGEVLVRTAWSLISPGTEQAVAHTAGRSLVGKALERPDQARKVVDKALRDGIGPARDAVRARLDDLITPGYSSAGVVEAVGPGVEAPRVGDRVGCVGANAACHAELAVVPAPLCVRLPAELDLRWGAFGALGAIAAHSVRVAGVAAGEVVAVVGLGLVGQLVAQVASAAGARVVGIDPSPDRVRLAIELGAVAGAGNDESDAERAVLGIGAGADSVIIAAAAKDSAPVRLAARLARDRAVVAVVGDVGLDVPRAPFYEKELQLRLSRSYGPGRYDPSYEEEGRDYPIGYVRWTERRLIAYVFDEIVAGRVRLEPLVTHEFELERGVEAYAALDEPARLAVLLRHPARPGPAVRRAAIAEPVRVDEPARSGDLRVGVIGPGLFARSTLLPLIAKRRVRLVAVAGATAPRAFGVARRAGADWVATDAGEVLGSSEIDAVVIATRHDSHAALAADALERGKSVFLEKPLAIDRGGLERVGALLPGGRLVVDFNRSFAPATTAVAAHFAGRADALHVHCRVNAGALPAEHWLRDPAIGGGRLVGEGCHFVDLCSTIVGAPVAGVAVQALASGPRTLPDDSWVLTLRYADGSVAVIGYVASGSARLAKERIEVHGAGRSAVVEDFRRHRLYGGARERLVRAPATFAAQDKGHGAALDAALAFFGAGGEPPVPYARMIETTLVTLVARDAMAAGRSEAIPLGDA